MRMLLIFAVFFTTSIFAQTEAELIEEIITYQFNENSKFKNPEKSILLKSDLEHFEGLKFYPIKLKYRVQAKFVRTPNEKPFLLPTTTDRLPEYVKYGEAHFSIDGKKLKLNLYQSTSHESETGYEDYLFLPFTDLTSGDGSYGGGRYIDCWIPEGTTITIDFNKAYNPYCAYNPRYSCPIPPKENDLLVRVEAGVMDFEGH